MIHLAGDLDVGGGSVLIMAGPCAVESRERIRAIASLLAPLGVRVLRGGAFKPRTRPGTFEGFGAKGLELIREAADENGMLVVTEVMEPEAVPLVAAYADIMQVGTRNAQNFPLLKALGRCGKPVLLKRGMSSTLSELLGAAEHVTREGNADVMLCERGIRGFDPATRNVFDVGGMVALREMTDLPIIADPSHAVGKRNLVPAVAMAAVAAGADGLIIEVHQEPDRSVSDAAQAMSVGAFEKLLEDLKKIATIMGRRTV